MQVGTLVNQSMTEDLQVGDRFNSFNDVCLTENNGSYFGRLYIC